MKPLKPNLHNCDYTYKIVEAENLLPVHKAGSTGSDSGVSLSHVLSESLHSLHFCVSSKWMNDEWHLTHTLQTRSWEECKTDNTLHNITLEENAS